MLLISLISASYADTARIIDSGEDALKIRMQLIESAKEEILISYFIFAEDNTALEMLSLLRKKAREGVRVRVIIDDLFNDIPKDIGTHLQQENVLIKNFNKFNFFRFGKSIKYRMHEKNFDDRDIYIVGSMALEASIYFNELWDAKHLKPFKQIKLKNNKASERLDEIENNFTMKKAMDTFDLKAWELDLPQVEHIDLFHDIIAPKKQKMTGTAKRLYDLIKNAAKSVIIDSPYLIITKELSEILKEVIARGVKIRFLTNSLKSTDGLFPQAAYMSQRKKIVDMGIELYEYFGDYRFHSKSLVIDDEIAAIGSFNFDPRSQNLNTETMAVIHDTKLAALLTQSMDESLKMSYRIDENGRPTGYENKYPGVTLKKKIITKLIQFIIVPFTKGLL